ncbi:MAG: Ig-like domain-containing protein [Gemmatimonadaceae bacterium]
MTLLNTRHSIRARRLIAVFAVTLAAGVACSDSGEPTAVVEVQIVTLPNNQSLTGLVPGTTRQMLGVPVNKRGNFVDKPVTWTSSNAARVSIDATGLATAVAGGTAYIRATVAGLTDSVAFNVRFPVGSVTIDPATLTLNREGSAVLTATVLDTEGTPVTNRPVTWSSSDETIATVSATGVVIASAVNEGPATITASASNATDGGGVVTGTASVTVAGAPVVHTVTVTGGSGFRGNTGTVQLTATPTSGSGNLVPGTTITWASSDVGVATVDATGLVTFQGATDTLRITATAIGQGASASDIEGGADFRVAVHLMNDDSLAVPTIVAGQSYDYAVAGGAADSVQITTFAGTAGDVDLYLFAPGVTNTTANNAGGTQAVAGNGFNGWMCRPWEIGSAEECRRVLSTSGWYRVRLYAYSVTGDVEGLTIRMRVIP